MNPVGKLGAHRNWQGFERHPFKLGYRFDFRRLERRAHVFHGEAGEAHQPAEKQSTCIPVARHMIEHALVSQHAVHGIRDKSAVIVTECVVLPEILIEHRVSGLFEPEHEAECLRCNVEQFALEVQGESFKRAERASRPRYESLHGLFVRQPDFGDELFALGLPVTVEKPNAHR
jgi:hypothetical protein